MEYLKSYICTYIYKILFYRNALLNFERKIGILVNLKCFTKSDQILYSVLLNIIENIRKLAT